MSVFAKNLTIALGDIGSSAMWIAAAFAVPHSPLLTLSNAWQEVLRQCPIFGAEYDLEGRLAECALAVCEPPQQLPLPLCRNSAAALCHYWSNQVECPVAIDRLACRYAYEAECGMVRFLCRVSRWAMHLANPPNGAVQIEFCLRADRRKGLSL